MKLRYLKTKWFQENIRFFKASSSSSYEFLKHLILFDGMVEKVAKNLAKSFFVPQIL